MISLVLQPADLEPMAELLLPRYERTRRLTLAELDRIDQILTEYERKN